MPDPIALIHFDSCVNTGLKQAAKFLQRSVGVLVDGVIGPATLAKIKNSDTKAVVGLYLIQRINFYDYLVEKNPTQSVFLKGWLNRVDALRAFILTL
jgi:lysozyme family protein